jgi:ribosomal protein S18 acetylase RimI-like enzyme
MLPSPSEIGLIPYVKLGEQWTLPDELILSIARQCEQEGTFKRVFYEGHIRTPEDFLAMMQKPANVPAFLFRGQEPLGFAWMNGIAGNVAFAHFCFLKASWGRDTDKMGRILLSYWMSFDTGAGPLLDVIFGTVPATNERAVNYVQRLGFVRLGEVPMVMKDAYTGDRASAVILYYSRFPDVKEGRR